MDEQIQLLSEAIDQDDVLSMALHLRTIGKHADMHEIAYKYSIMHNLDPLTYCLLADSPGCYNLLINAGFPLMWSYNAKISSDIFRKNTAFASSPVKYAYYLRDMLKNGVVDMDNLRRYAKLVTRHNVYMGEDSVTAHAILRGKKSIAKVLIEEGIQLDNGCYGKPCLHAAISVRETDLVEMLVQAGCDINQTECAQGHKTVNMNPPLLEAIKYKEWDIYQILLDAGADTSICSVEGHTLDEYLRMYKDDIH